MRKVSELLSTELRVSQTEWRECERTPTGEKEELVVTIYGGESSEDVRIIARTEVLTDIVLCGDSVKEWRLCDPVVYETNTDRDMWINKICVSQPRVLWDILPVRESPLRCGCPIAVPAGKKLKIEFPTVMQRLSANERT